MPRPKTCTHLSSIAASREAPCTAMAGTVIQGWRRKVLSERSRSWDVETETTPPNYCRASTESPHYSSAGCWELTKVRWQASTCRTTWMNSRFGSIAGDPRAVASSSSGLCSKRSIRLPLPTKLWSSGQRLTHYRLGQAESRGYPLTRNTRNTRDTRDTEYEGHWCIPRIRQLLFDQLFR